MNSSTAACHQVAQPLPRQLCRQNAHPASLHPSSSSVQSVSWDSVLHRDDYCAQVGVPSLSQKQFPSSGFSSLVTHSSLKLTISASGAASLVSSLASRVQPGPGHTEKPPPGRESGSWKRLSEAWGLGHHPPGSEQVLTKTHFCADCPVLGPGN